MSDEQPLAEATPVERRSRPRRRWRSAEEIRTRRHRVVAWALLVGSFALVINALVGDNGYLASLHRRQQYDVLMASLSRLETENQRLIRDNERLRTPAGLEEAARGELGMIRPGETLIVIRDVRPATPAEPPH
jgi:cell division protein FtsB